MEIAKLNENPVKSISLEDQYTKFKKLRKQDVQELEKWICDQPHLPHSQEQFLMQVLCSCNFDKEATKKCLEYYYTIRANFPPVFSNRDPELIRIQNVIYTFVSEPFPNLTKEGFGVVYSKVLDPDIDKYDYLTQNKLFDMRLHAWLKTMGCVKGVHIIVDMEGTNLKHVQKMGYFNVRKMIGYLTEGLPINIKGIHMVNPTNFLDYCFKLLYPLINEELRALLHVYHGEELFDHLPRNCVPDELKGTGGSIKSLHESFIKILTENRDFFLEDEKWKADESKREKQGFLKRFGW